MGTAPSASTGVLGPAPASPGVIGGGAPCISRNSPTLNDCPPGPR
jgi:hypothetical protein